jgi:alpha,alpha-trehalase
LLASGQFGRLFQSKTSNLGLYGTAKNMIENFALLVQKYGFIPNGGRVYYLGRSQPPMLIGMLYEYYDKTHDIEFLAKNIDVMEKVCIDF